MRRARSRSGGAELDRTIESTSRASSTSSGREVRCACQYYMSDNPLPERVVLYGSRPPSRNSYTEMAKQLGDHEYEPINPPPTRQASSSEGPTSTETAKAGDEDTNARRFIRIPRDDELVVTSSSPEDMEVAAIGAAHQFQDDLEDRFLHTSMTTTTASRTDCDVNTSMLDSSGLEDLPLKRDSRSKKALQSKTEQMRAQAQSLQQRMRAQAGKLRNKLRNIPRPSFPRKQEKADSEVKPRFRLPERPKFNLPDRPKFNLPDRPKFNLPERPKFKMPQKPKINLPNFTKPLRERQVQTKPDEAHKKNMFDLDFRTYPRMFNKKSRDRGEYSTSSPKLPRSATPPPAPIQPARKKGPVGQRWVHRFDDIKFADDKTSEQSAQSDRTAESASLSGYDAEDFGIADDFEESQLPPPRARSTKSSISHISDRDITASREAEDRHKRGVLEEIDSDQFFLRQKGISEDDINMGKYLSEEIREAFKSPVVNALRQLDMDYEETKENENILGKMDDDPLPPTRTRSLQRTRKVHSTEERTLEKESTVPKISTNNERTQSRYENVQEGVTSSQPCHDSIDGDNQSDYYKTPPPPQEYQHYKVPRPTPQPASRKEAEQTLNKKKSNEGWVAVEVETSLEEVPLEPQPLQRKKSKKGLQGSPNVQDVKAIESKETGEPDIKISADMPPDAPKRTRSLSRGAHSMHSMAQEEDQPVAPKRAPSKKSLQSLGLSDPPRELDDRSVHSLAFDDRRVGAIAPKRLKSLSRGSRGSYHSLTNESDVTRSPQPPKRLRSLSRNSHATRSYHSLADDERSWAPQAPERTPSLSRPSKSKQIIKQNAPEQTNHYEMPSEDGYAGYAVVEKPKPTRPPPPRRQRRSYSPNFNTFPRRSPIRPVRNYATLGPARPPRKSKRPLQTAQSLEHIYASDQISVAYAQVPDNAAHSDEVDESSKDLHASTVIEKMKGRPLPAPPRPPRLKGKSEEQNPSLEIVEEVCVSTQTDPLPDDVCLEDDVIQEFSHEQLRIQEEFLKEMRDEEERIQREIEARRARHIDVTIEREQNEAKMEIIRQMDDIIKEERRLLLDERQADEDDAQQEAKKTQQVLEMLEDDMGYASLDRRQQPQPSTSFQEPRHPVEPPPQAPSTPTPQQPVYIPLVPEIVSTERLRVGQLEVDRLSVNQLEATNLTVRDLRTHNIETQNVLGNTFQVQDVASHSGNLTLRNIELPPEFIQQIIARIPWEELRPPQSVTEQQSPQPTLRKAAGANAATEDEPTQSFQSQTGSMRRRHRAVRHRSRSQFSSDSDEEESHLMQSVRRPARVPLAEPRVPPTIGELGQQLARACTSAGVRAMRDFAARVRPPAAEEDRTRYVQAVLLVALVAIAGFILFGLRSKDVHHHHWDFQFPPQPPHH